MERHHDRSPCKSSSFGATQLLCATKARIGNTMTPNNGGMSITFDSCQTTVEYQCNIIVYSAKAWHQKPYASVTTSSAYLSYKFLNGL